MRLQWDVDDFSVEVVVGKLEDGIEAGMEEAVDRIIELLTREAVDTIRVNRRVFTKQLVKSFDDQTGSADIKSGHEGRLLNVSRHAGAVEWGVHASKYADGGPPISALMPWVVANLQDWNLEDSDGPTSGNSLKQSIEAEVSQSVSENVDLFAVENLTHPALEQEQKRDLKNTMKSSSLDDISVDTLFRQVRGWKEDSSPTTSGSHYEKVIQYSSDAKTTFGIDGTVRGLENYTPEPTYEETQDALRTLHEISKVFAYNHLDDGGGAFQAGRWTGSVEMSRLGKRMWEDPGEATWSIDNNILRNYSTTPDNLKSIFNKGLRHDESVDIEDDLVFVVDALIDARNNREHEVHLRGGDGVEYNRDDLTFTHPSGTTRRADEVLDSDFEAVNFADMDDSELLALSSIVRAMGSESVTVDTQIARDRLNAWLDEFLDRGLDLGTGTSDFKWEQYVDTITS